MRNNMIQSIPFRMVTVPIREWYKNREHVEKILNKHGHSRPFIQNKAEYLFDFVFDEDEVWLEGKPVQDVNITFFYTLKGYCWWFTYCEDSEESLREILRDVRLFTECDDIVELLYALKENGEDLNTIDIHRQEYIQEKLNDVKWCMAMLFECVTFHGNVYSLNKFKWNDILEQILEE